MAKDINIGGRLHSIATGNVVAGADEILDDNLGKKQTQINTETYSLVESVNNALAELSPDQQEALGVATKANANEAKLGYYVCDTGAAVAAKTIAATGYVLGTGGNMRIKMTNANTADAVTLNINNTGAKALYYNGTQASSTNSWEAGEVIEVYYDGTNYQAFDTRGSRTSMLFPNNIVTSGLRCQSTNMAYLTVTNSSDNNYVVTSLEQTGLVYGRIYLPTMKNGKRYSMQFSYTNTNTGSQDWSIGGSTIKPMRMQYTTTPLDYSWDFTYSSNMTYLNFYCNNMVAGAVITIINLKFIPLDSYETLVSKVENISALTNKIAPKELNTNNLICASTDTNYLTVECVSDNNYLVTSITRQGYKYGYIKLPQLIIGTTYRLTFDCITDNNFSASLAVSSLNSGNKVITNIPAHTHGKLVVEFTYTGEDCLMFYCNDIQTGKTIALNNLTIVPADNLTAVQNYVNSELSIGDTLYAAQRKISLKKRNPFSCKITKPKWTIAQGQAMAIYNNYIVKIKNDGTLTLLQYADDTITTIFTSSNSLTGHNNSAQFAPYKGDSQEFPYLYVSAYNRHDVPVCKVYELTTFSVTLVQTITFNLPESIMGTNDDKNTQIGDDGCLYMYSLTSGVVKLATPNVGDGDVMLTTSDVLDFFRFYYAYSDYTWQGGTIYNGMLFMPTSAVPNGGPDSLFVFDLAAHTLLMKMAVPDSYGDEVEDCDIMDGKLYLSTLAGKMIVIDFDS